MEITQLSRELPDGQTETNLTCKVKVLSDTDIRQCSDTAIMCLLRQCVTSVIPGLECLHLNKMWKGLVTTAVRSVCSES